MSLPALSTLPTFPSIDIILPNTHLPSQTHLIIPQSLPELAAALRKWSNIFPKINDKAPKDVTWISRGIETEDNAWEKMFASDRIRWKTEGNILTIRKYFDINMGMEFRCFVKNKILRGKKGTERNRKKNEFRYW
jgi:hypothetical protein